MTSYRNLSQNTIESYFGDIDPIAYCQGKTADEIAAELIETWGDENAEEINEIATAVYNEINRNF